MTTPSKIQDFVAYGTHASRPSTPNIPTGTTSIYYETDTGNAFLWTGSTWVQVNASAGASIVQRAGFASSATGVNTGVVFGSAPTAGNLLLAMVMDFGSSTINGTGWTGLVANGAAADGFGFGFKIAGVSESTTQTPTTDTNAGSLAVWEVSGGIIGASNYQERSASVTGGVAHTLGFTTTKANAIHIGAFDLTNSQTPTALTGMAHSNIITGTSRTLIQFDTLVTSAGAQTAGFTPASSASCSGGIIPIG